MQTVTFVIAFIVVLALIAGAAWLVRRFAGDRLGVNANRGRMPRLAVIDAAAVDGRRRLVLVRRDNVEHLLMIGGPTDIVVEHNIVRASPMTQRPLSGVETSRLPPLAETGWTESDSPRSDPPGHPEPPISESPPSARPPFADAPRRPVPAERRSDPLAGFTPEPMSRTDIRGARPARQEPVMPRPTPPPAPTLAPSPASDADQNLAEMAQRLEAALRRPTGDSKPPAAAPVTSEPPPRPRSMEGAPGSASRSEPSAPPPVVPPGPKSGFEHLENEMASLLGRSKSPS
jgi:hypothetical protein